MSLALQIKNLEYPEGWGGVGLPWPKRPDLKKFTKTFYSSFLARFGAKLA